MNSNYIQQGDCLELLKQLPDKSIDLVVTVPYHVDKQWYIDLAQERLKGFGA